MGLNSKRKEKYIDAYNDGAGRKYRSGLMPLNEKKFKTRQVKLSKMY